jgi:hypothetical protein
MMEPFSRCDFGATRPILAEQPRRSTAGVRIGFGTYPDSRAIAVQYETSFEKYTGNAAARLRGLPQSEIAGDEQHHHNNTHNVENIVHVSSPFFRVIRFALEPLPLTMTERKGG